MCAGIIGLGLYYKHTISFLHAYLQCIFIKPSVLFYAISFWLTYFSFWQERSGDGVIVSNTHDLTLHWHWVIHQQAAHFISLNRSGILDNGITVVSHGFNLVTFYIMRTCTLCFQRVLSPNIVISINNHV